MASIADLINETSKNALCGILAEEERMYLEERKNKLKRTGFRTIGDVISYLKTGEHVLFYYMPIRWDDSDIDRPIVWRHQVSDGYDCVFWDVDTKMSEREFKIKFDKGVDEFGYLNGFTKNGI